MVSTGSKLMLLIGEGVIVTPGTVKEYSYTVLVLFRPDSILNVEVVRTYDGFVAYTRIAMSRSAGMSSLKPVSFTACPLLSVRHVRSPAGV